MALARIAVARITLGESKLREGQLRESRSRESLLANNSRAFFLQFRDAQLAEKCAMEIFTDAAMAIARKITHFHSACAGALHERMGVGDVR